MISQPGLGGPGGGGEGAPRMDARGADRAGSLMPGGAPAGEKQYDKINDYSAVSITLASPNDIRSWSYGEVKKPETMWTQGSP